MSEKLIDEIKPCPFCGNEAHIFEEITDSKWGIVCSHCGANLYSWNARDQLIEDWNTHPIEDTLRTKLEEWRADAERLAKHLSLLKFASLEFRDEIEADLDIHHILVEKEKK